MSDITWEPEKNLDSPAVIAANEDVHKQKTVEPEDMRKKCVGDRGSSPTPDKKVKSARYYKGSVESTRGFQRGLEPEEILGTTDASGERFYLIKWKNSHLADLVSAKEANEKCPQIVIRFYEGKVPWQISKHDKHTEN